MQEQYEEHDIDVVDVRQTPSWPTAITMFLAIILLFATFYWVFTRIEPILDDVVVQSSPTPSILTTGTPDIQP